MLLNHSLYRNYFLRPHVPQHQLRPSPFLRIFLPSTYLFKLQQHQRQTVVARIRVRPYVIVCCTGEEEVLSQFGSFIYCFKFNDLFESHDSLRSIWIIEFMVNVVGVTLSPLNLHVR